MALKSGDPLGANGEPVGGVLHVAAGVDAAVGILQRGADLEMRVRREGVLARRERGLQERVDHTSLGSSAFR